MHPTKLNDYIDRYKKSWMSENSRLIANRIILLIRLMFAMAYFVGMILVLNRILPPPTLATVDLIYNLITVLIRVPFIVVYLVIDWIIFVRMRER